MGFDLSEIVGGVLCGVGAVAFGIYWFMEKQKDYNNWVREEQKEFCRRYWTRHISSDYSLTSEDRNTVKI